MSQPVRTTTMLRALNAALKAADIDPRDAAAVNLARLLAKSVDEGRMQDAPRLLAVMTSLGLTPGGRKPAPGPASSAPAAGVDSGDVPVESGGAQGVAALAAIRAHRADAAAAEGS